MGKSKRSNKLHQSNKTRLQELKRTEKERQADCILKIKNHVETSINICKNDLGKTRLYEAEKTISKLGYEFGRLLIELYLILFHMNVDYMKRLSQNKYYLKTKLKYRQIKTMFGVAIYGRCYLEGKKGEKGIYAADKELGVRGDGFSPMVIQKNWGHILHLDIILSI